MRTLIVTFEAKSYSIRVSHVHLKANFVTKFGALRMQSEFGSLYI
jgi:hypothetical protein